MTLRTRLALGLLAIALMLMAPLYVARESLKNLNVTLQNLRRNEFSASLLLGRLRGQVDEVRRAELVLRFGKGKSETLMGFDEQYGHLTSMVDSLRLFGIDAGARRINGVLHNMPELAHREFAAVTVDDTLASDSLGDSVRVLVDRSDQLIRRVESDLRLLLQQRVDEVSARSEQAETAGISAIVLAGLVATASAFWLIRSISGPVRDLERGMEAVAGGQFGYRLRVTPKRNDEFGRLAASYHSMSAQLAELDKLKAEFVSVASHELKTPINVIGGYLQLLDEGVYGPLSAKQREVCDTLSAQCDSLARLVRQLLDMSRFEAGGGKIEPRRFVLRTFLDDLERAFQVLAMQRDVHFRVTRAVGLPEEVTWDADRINEVLGNMLSNAFKFTPRGGTVDLMAEPDDRVVQITVRDTGAGIPPAQLPHIFKKFYQADNQSSASAKGTGLGLAISKGIVDAHGGSIAVDSTVNVGTTFTIVLPEHVRFGRRTASQPRVPAAASV